MPTVADTQRLIELHADGSEEAMKEVAKIHRSYEPSKPKSSAPRKSASSKSKK